MQILTDGPVQRANVHRHAKFPVDHLDLYGDMAGFDILRVCLENAYSCPFWVVFWGFDPLDGIPYQPILQKLNLRVIAVPLVSIVVFEKLSGQKVVTKKKKKK